VLGQELINHLLELPLRSGADELLYDLSVLEEENRRYAHDLVPPGNLGILVGVELSDLDLSGIFIG